LVIIVTPYLVKPVDPSQLKLPTDGYKAPSDAERWLLGTTFKGDSGTRRPAPVVAPGAAAPPAAIPSPAAGGK
jgi:pilus assembly protein CpaC